jgi:hypothetical protein
MVSLVKLKGVRIASNVRKRAADKWDDVWLWVTDDKLCFAAKMEQHGTPKKSFNLSALQNLEDVDNTGFKFQVDCWRDCSAASWSLLLCQDFSVWSAATCDVTAGL